MNHYEAPSSDVRLQDAIDKPIKALGFGLLIAVVGVFLFSMVGTIGFAIVQQVDLSSENAVRSAVSSSPVFLLMDLVGTWVILLLAGKVIAKYAPARTWVYALIVTAVVALVFGGPLFTKEALSAYPIWYTVTIGLSLLLGIPLGAKAMPVSGSVTPVN